MSSMTVYQGWKYDFDEKRPSKERFVATKGELVMRGASDRHIRTLIENYNEEQSEKAGAL